MIWGAGWHKAAGENAQIGVHGARAVNIFTSNEQVAIGTLTMARTLAEEKAPPAVVASVATTESADMHWLTAADAAAWGTTILDKDGRPEN